MSTQWSSHAVSTTARTVTELWTTRLRGCVVWLVLLLGALPASAQQYSWSTIAGTAGATGATDSPGLFDGSWMVARDSSGNLYVPCYYDHTIRKVTPAGVVSTYSGLSGNAGTVNGTSGAGGTARFNGPLGIAIDSSNNIYVSEYDSHTIRKITPAGAVTTLAGTVNTAGTTDGAVGVGKFYAPWGIAVDGSGNVYVADYGNHTIRKVTPGGVTSTLAGLATNPGSSDGTGTSARFNYPTGVALDANGNLVVCGYDPVIRRVTPEGVVTTLAGSAGSYGGTDGTGNAARFWSPLGIAVDGTSNTIFVADDTAIRRITPGGVVTTVAGLHGWYGNVDGVGSNARLNGVSGIIADGTSNTLFVAEQASNTIRKVSYDGVCTAYAGTPGLAGSAAPVGALSGPAGIARDSSGNLYIACQNSHVIYRVTGGVMTLFAGTVNTAGTADGTGTAARFNYPWGIECDAAGNVFVADAGNHSIRKITPAGVVTTLAGLSGTPGSADGTGNAARFNNPNDVKVDTAGNVYVSDGGNNTIRKVTSGGVVTTLAGQAGSAGSTDGTGSAARFNFPTCVAVDAAGNVYAGEWNNATIRKITPAGVVTTLAGLAGSFGSTDGTGSAARFNIPYGLVLDSAGNLIVSDLNNDTLRKVTPAGVVTTICGSPGSVGDADGVGSAARLDSPIDLTIDPQDNIYLLSYTRHTVRKITPGGAVSTYIGAAGIAGTQSTPLAINTAAASFDSCSGVARDSDGNLFVTDADNNTIRKITPAGVVSTFAGLAGNSGSTDGTGGAARFSGPYAIAIDGSNNLYVADLNNHTIRKITPGAVVTTLAGTAGAAAFADGAGAAARFNYPYGIAAEANGTVYVADYSNHRIRKIVGNVVTTLAGSGSATEADGTGAGASFNGPNGICVDSGGFVFVADYSGRTVRKITPAGVVTTLAGLANTPGSTDGTGNGARFNQPEGITCDALGQNIFVTDGSNQTIRKVTAAGVVTTVGGFAGANSSADGVGSAARFSYPVGIILDPSGNLILADAGNDNIRKGTRYGTKARIVLPANGGSLPAPVTVFGWEPGIGATAYWLTAGTTPGGTDLYNANVGLNLFRVLSLPADIKVYVTLWTQMGGAWQANYYQYNPAPSQRAVVTSPAQGSNLGSATLSLQWAAGLGCAQYAIYVGSAYNGTDLGNASFGIGANTASFPVPTDGGPIYVTLWSKVNGVWQRSDSWYTAQTVAGNRPAKLTVPALIGSTLAGAVTTFNWDAGVGATSYHLYVGSAPDGNDLYSASQGVGLTNNVTLPVDGRKVYVTLFSFIGGAWLGNSYQFTCATIANPGSQILTPAPGSNLGSASLNLTWGAIAGATSYHLYVGSSPGDDDIYTMNEGLGLARAVPVPTDGRALYAQIWTKINGVWHSNIANYNAANTGATQRAQITSHASGTSLPEASTTFVWNAGVGGSSYWLYVGSTPGGNDLYSANQNLLLTRTVTVPTDGRKIYVTLFTVIGGVYVPNYFGYTAPLTPAFKATLISPANGSTLTSASATFDWQAGSAGTTQYHLYIGSRPGASDLFSGGAGLLLTKTVTGLPTDGRPLYLTLYSLINGVWLSNEYFFTAWQAP